MHLRQNFEKKKMFEKHKENAQVQKENAPFFLEWIPNFPTGKHNFN